MIVLGLTGSIGMGKSATAALFARRGVPVFDADAQVHALMAPGAAGFRAVAAAFPEAVINGRIDRPALGALVFKDPAAKARLEALLHPLVFRAQWEFLARCCRQRRRHVVLDVPLLLETGGRTRVDWVVVVTAPAFLQRQRVLARPGMTEQRFQGILSAQMPDRDKRRHADFLIPTGLGFRVASEAVGQVLRTTRRRAGRVWPRPRPIV
ncbi:MAG: dephospho-CoA kinase [Rhodothalassiaceae bacterium]